MKTNHGSGYNIIVQNKKELNMEEVKNKINKWMGINYAFGRFGFQYLNIKPKIIAEKYLENIDGDLYDYKIFLFQWESRKYNVCK